MKLSKIALFTFALLLALTLLVACGGDEPAASSASAPNANPPAAVQDAAPVTLPSDPKAAILQAMRTQLTAGPYRNTTTVIADGTDETDMKSVGEVILPDQLHITANMGGMSQEMIFIGDKGWTKTGDGDWEEANRLGQQMFAQFGESMIADMEKTITGAAFVGTEQVEGVDALLYTFTTDHSKSALMQIEGTSNVKLWIDAATGLIIQQEIEGEAMGVKSTTVQVIEYDANIKIEPPMQ